MFLQPFGIVPLDIIDRGGGLVVPEVRMRVAVLVIRRDIGQNLVEAVLAVAPVIQHLVREAQDPDAAVHRLPLISLRIEPVDLPLQVANELHYCRDPVVLFVVPPDQELQKCQERSAEDDADKCLHVSLPPQ